MLEIYPEIRERVEWPEEHPGHYHTDVGIVLKALDKLAEYTKRLEEYSRVHSKIALSHGEGHYDDVLVERRDALPDEVKEFLDD